MLVRRLMVGVVAGFVAIVVIALAAGAVASVTIREMAGHRFALFGLELVTVGTEGGATVVSYGPGLWVAGVLAGFVNAGVVCWRLRDRV